MSLGNNGGVNVYDLLKGMMPGKVRRLTAFGAPGVRELMGTPAQMKQMKLRSLTFTPTDSHAELIRLGRSANDDECDMDGYVKPAPASATVRPGKLSEFEHSQTAYSLDSNGRVSSVIEQKAQPPRVYARPITVTYATTLFQRTGWLTALDEYGIIPLFLKYPAVVFAGWPLKCMSYIYHRNALGSGVTGLAGNVALLYLFWTRVVLPWAKEGRSR